MEKVGIEGCPDYSIHELKEKKSKYCLCIFALNEKGRIDSELGKIRHISEKWDVILADGNSTDGTNDLDFLRENNLRALLIKKSAGKLGAQMRMAFHYAMEQGYEGVVVVDGNDKDDVARSFDDFITKLDQGYDHIQGSRYIVGGIHENTPKSRHFAVRFIHAPLITMASGFMCTDTTNGFRAYSRKLLTDPGIAVMRDVLSGYELHYYVAIEASNQGFKMAEIPVTRSYPDSGNIPSKIVGMSGNFKVLKTLFSTAFGEFRVGSDTSFFGRIKSFFSFLIADRLPVSLDARIISGMISLLFTALILSAGIDIKDAPITDFSQRTIGQVVLDGVNADHRNKVFVLGFVLGVNIFLLINRIILFLTLFYRKTFGDNILKTVGILAAVSIVPLALAKFDGSFAYIRDFFLYSFLWLFSFVTITSIRGYFDPHINSSTKKVWKEAIMLGLCPVTAWVFKDLIFHGTVNLSSKEFYLIYLSSLVLSLLQVMFLKKHLKTIFQFGRIQIYFLLVSIISLFIGQELQFFLSQKGSSFSYYLTYSVCLLTGLSVGYITRKKLLSPRFDYLKFIVFPLAVICFFFIRNFKSNIVIDLFDWFHIPERIIPVMQFLDFGKITWFDIFATHGFSDAPYGWFWAILQGTSGYQFMAWEYLYITALFVGVYFVFSQFFSSLTAFLMTIGLSGRIIPDTSSTSIFVSALFILPAILFFKAEKKILKILLAFLVFFTFFYYPTIGVPVIASLIFTFLGLSISQKINFKHNFLTIVLGFGTLLLFLCVLYLKSDANLVNSLKLWGEFVKVQAQAMSYNTMTNGRLTQEVFMYFIQPLILILFGFIFIKLVFKKKEIKSWEIPFLILTCFYIIHFTRLIQRHSLFEMYTVEGAIVLSIIYLYCRLSTALPRSIDVCFIAFVSLGEVIVPSYLGIPYSPKIIETVTWKANEKRVQFAQKDDQDPLINFLRSNLKNKETFYDFSNTPALYMLTQKEFPTFFIPEIYQTSQKSQESVLKDLTDRIDNLKYVIFARYPNENMWNNVDGVSHRLRSYLITEFIFKNFYRCKDIDGWDIWCSNSLKEPKLGNKYFEFNTKYLPYIWGNFDKKLTPKNEIKVIDKSLIINPEKPYFIDFNKVDYKKYDYLDLEICSFKEEADIEISFVGSTDKNKFRVLNCNQTKKTDPITNYYEKYTLETKNISSQLSNYCNNSDSGVLNAEFKCEKSDLNNYLNKSSLNFELKKYQFEGKDKFLLKIQEGYSCNKANFINSHLDNLDLLGCKLKEAYLTKVTPRKYLGLLNIFESWNRDGLTGMKISSSKKLLITSANLVEDSTFYDK